MAKVSLFLRISLSKKLNGFSFFDMGKNDKEYFDDKENIYIAQDYYENTLKPVISDLLKLKDKIKVNLSIGGVALDMFSAHVPEALKLIREFADSKNVELVGEPHHNSISYLFSEAEFKEQVKLHVSTLEKHFNKKPLIFRNTDYSFSEVVESNLNGFEGIIVAEYVDSNKVYKTKTGKAVLIRSSQLVRVTQDINVLAFDIEYLLNEDYQSALQHIVGKHEFLFGSEMAKLASEEFKQSGTSKLTNNIQNSALKELVKLEHKVKATQNKVHVDNWRQLCNFEYYLNMSDENISNDPSAYEVFINYVTVLKDLDTKLS